MHLRWSLRAACVRDAACSMCENMLHVPTCACADLRMSVFPHVPTCACAYFRMPVFPHARISACADLRMPVFPHVSNLRMCVFPHVRPPPQQKRRRRKEKKKKRQRQRKGPRAVGAILHVHVGILIQAHGPRQEPRRLLLPPPVGPLVGVVAVLCPLF